MGGFSAPGPRATARMRRSKGGHRLLSEINVTPLVDVMLVLLIVFMVAAPLLTVGVPIELPRSEAAALQMPADPVTVSIAVNGQIHVQDAPVEIDRLVELLARAAKDDLETQIYVRADRHAVYGDVIKVIGRINSAGFSRLGLVSLEAQGASDS